MATVEDAIAEAGLSDKITVNAITEDDGSTNATASEATTKLIKVDNASVILGPCCSGVTVAIATAITDPRGRAPDDHRHLSDRDRTRG